MSSVVQKTSTNCLFIKTVFTSVKIFVRDDGFENKILILNAIRAMRVNNYFYNIP